MPRFFELQEKKGTGVSGYLDGTRKWSLPGVQCPACGAGWSGLGEAYPSVDLSQHPERLAFEHSQSDSIEEFERLRELVRPLAPRGARLEPGTLFGPLIATATGRFGDFYLPMPWMLMVKREAQQKLLAEGVRGFNAYPAQVRFRQKNAPELLDVELQPHGRLHPSCHTPNWERTCLRCGRNGNTLPDKLMLDGATLPGDVDVFRLCDYATVLIASERFAAAVARLGLSDLVLLEVPVR